MTVHELIEKLNTFDPSLRVVTPGFDESNLDDVETVEEIFVIFHDDHPRGHCGQHEDAQKRFYTFQKEKDNPLGIKAVKINF